MSLDQSKPIAKIDIPEVQSLQGKFVYNFFVPDEMTNFSNPIALKYQNVIDDTKYLQLLTSSNAIARDAIVPRYITLSWLPVAMGPTLLGGGAGPIEAKPEEFKRELNWNLEEGIVPEGDVFYTCKDPHVVTRNRSLLQRCALVHGIIHLSDLTGSMYPVMNSDQVTQLVNMMPSLDSNKIARILSPSDQMGVKYINNVNEAVTPQIFSKASTLTTTAVMDYRTWSNSLSGFKNETTPSRATMQKHAGPDGAGALLSKNSIPSSQTINFKIFNTEEADSTHQSNRISSRAVGYLIDRSHVQRINTLPVQKQVSTTQYLVEGGEIESFIDDKIAYGYEYTYTVRTISQVMMTLAQSNNVVEGVVLSNPSTPVSVPAFEMSPPLSPDGLIFKFDYTNKAGLYLIWQMPVGKQRDVKYFQVFRRKTIYEPFTCIGQIDFDNSHVRIPLTEYVRDENTIKTKHPRTWFRDSEFSRQNKKFIYAVAAVDAHGLSSGYSVQVLVDFDTKKNRLALEKISSPDAPKQYPNFYIDPNLDDNITVDSFVQNVMRSSLKHKMRVYLDLDALTCTSEDMNEQAGSIPPEKIVEYADPNSPQPSDCIYKLHLLNVDRQKSQVMEFRIKDKRNVDQT